MNYDRELLRRFYLNEGYVDFRVLSAVRIDARPRGFLHYLYGGRGAALQVGKISLKSEIKGLDAEKLRQYLTTKEGNWYSADQIDKSITALTTVLGDKQYAFANIVPMPNRHKDTHIVDLTYDIKQGERVYIGRITVSGNTRTVDKVIRREMRLAEGDPFSSTKLHLSEQSLKDLNFFKTVEVKPVDGDQPDRANINVKVEEKSTGEISVGAGFSSTDGLWATSTSMKAISWGRARMRASASPFQAASARSTPASPSLTSWIAIFRPASICSTPRPTIRI